MRLGSTVISQTDSLFEHIANTPPIPALFNLLVASSAEVRQYAGISRYVANTLPRPLPITFFSDVILALIKTSDGSSEQPAYSMSSAKRNGTLFLISRIPENLELTGQLKRFEEL
jgi:hypothetical protein